MQIQRVNRTDAEKVFLVIQNVEAITATTGLGMRYCGGAAAEIASTDGVQCVQSTDATMANFVGIAVQDIPSNGYGRVQAWGIVSIAYSAIADVTVGVTSIATSFLKHEAANKGFVSTQTPQALSTMCFKYVQAFTTVNVSGGIPMGTGFVRAL